MQAQSISTVLLVDDVPVSLSFYKKQLGFETKFELPWFASMAHPSGGGLIDLWQREHPSVPARIKRPPGGVLLALMVEDATLEYQRLSRADVRVVEPLRDEPWGQRHFIAADPSGFLIDVVQRIEPKHEWLVENGLST